VRELPSGWKRATLNVLGLPRGKTIDPRLYPNEVFELYSVPSYLEGTPEIVHGSQIGSAKQVVSPGDVLLCKIVPHLVRVWVVPEPSTHRQIASGEWIVIRCPETDAHYLRYLLTERQFRDQFMATVSGVGGSLLRARPSDVAKIPLAIAPVPEQRRIVAKLDSLFGRTRRARQELSHIPRLIENYKQAILAAAFRGELTAEWQAMRKEPEIGTDALEFLHARRAARAALQVADDATRDTKTSMVERDTDLQVAIDRRTDDEPLPQGWQWVGLGELFSVFVGATPSRKRSEYWDGDIAWVSSGEVAFRRISKTEERITAEGLRNASTRIHPPGTVLLGMIGEGKTRGQTAILDIPSCNNQNCAAIRVSEAGFSPEFLFWYLFAQYERTRTVGAGNNQPALNKTRVQRLLMPLPPPAEAFRVAAVIEDAFGWVESVREHCEQSTGLINDLDQANLAKAFRGELVPQDPNDEPASVLLERICAARAEQPKNTRKGRGRTANASVAA
jgi:type I restriction enzyme, S subunit